MIQTWLFLFLNLTAQAEVKIAFVQMRDTQNNVVQLEPNGEYAHIALSYKGQWLHVHPYRGVELVSSGELAQMGILDVITLTDKNEPSESKVKSVLGQPFDREFKWKGNKNYCAKLVGQMLDIAPRPMHFEADIWKTVNPLKNTRAPMFSDEWGLSPDDIFHELMQIHPSLRKFPVCNQVFLK